MLTPRLSRQREVVLIGTGLVVLLVFFVHRAGGWNDVALYRAYATSFWSGGGAFRSFPTEYPPLSILVFTLTLVPAIRDTATVFAVWMTAAFWIGYWGFRRFEGSRAAALYASYLLLGAAATLLNRYDLVPALCVVGALWAASRERWRLAYLLLAAGVLLKLYPLLLLPLFVIAQRRAATSSDWRSVSRAAWPAAALGFGVLGLAAALDLNGALSPFMYAAARPLQVESAPASALWLLSFAGFPALSDRGFHSYNLVGPLGPVVGGLFSVVMVAALAALYWRFASGRLSLARACLAAVCCFVLGSKVFSPQYLIWILPLVAMADDRLDWTWVAIAALTTLIYPVLYVADGVLGTPGPFPYGGDMLLAIAVRNLLLGVATARAFLPDRALDRVPVAPALTPAGD